MDRILILGASGFAGQAISRQLRNTYSVFGTYHSRKDKFEGSTGMFPLDVGDPDELEKILEQTRPQVIISSLRGDFGLQLTLHRKTAEYIAGIPNGKFIFLSTANVFDNQPSAPHYEQDETDAQSEYGKFKIACETMLRDILKEKCIILRVPQIWGYNCPRLVKLKADTESGNVITTWTNISVNYTLDTQIAGYVEYILEKNLTGIFHIGSTDVFDYAGFQKELAARLGMKTPRFEAEVSQQKEYQAVLTARTDIPEKLLLTVNDILDYLTKGTD